MRAHALVRIHRTPHSQQQRIPAVRSTGNSSTGAKLEGAAPRTLMLSCMFAPGLVQSIQSTRVRAAAHSLMWLKQLQDKQGQ